MATINGGNGNDSLNGTSGAYTIYGNTRNDTLSGEAGNDLLVGDLAGVAFNQSGTNGVGLSSNITDFPTTQLSYELTFSSDQDPTDQIQLGSYAVSGSDNEFLAQAESGAITIILGGLVKLTLAYPALLCLTETFILWQSPGTALRAQLMSMSMASADTRARISRAGR